MILLDSVSVWQSNLVDWANSDKVLKPHGFHTYGLIQERKECICHLSPETALAHAVEVEKPKADLHLYHKTARVNFFYHSKSSTHAFHHSCAPLLGKQQSTFEEISHTGLVWPHRLFCSLAYCHRKALSLADFATSQRVAVQRYAVTQKAAWIFSVNGILALCGGLVQDRHGRAISALVDISRTSSPDRSFHSFLLILTAECAIHSRC